MNERELDRLLRRIPNASPPSRKPAGLDFADAILSRLPGMRYVIPGSHPGIRILVLAGILGLLTAIGISLYQRRAAPARPEPPPLTLFQPGAVETPAPSAN